MNTRILFLSACCLLLTVSTSQWTNAAKPNVIFILTDDQGYGDFSCHGSPILATPHMDRLHNEGAKFVDFHVSPTCAPTRAALLTGCHEFRSGVTHTIFERERLALDAVTLADVFSAVGYATGIFGKWHLGDEPAYQPNERGFKEVFIHGGGGIGQTYPGSCGDAPNNTYFDPAILHNGSFVKTKGYCTDLFFSQALAWIESVKQDKPFFAYIALNAPHDPLQVPFEYQKQYADRVPVDTAKFYGMIANIDDNIGRLLTALEKWEIDSDTLVVFMNDNGGMYGRAIYNAGMRGGKNSPWLGGTRAASFWRWPGTIEPKQIDVLAAHFDFLPTVAELTGTELSENVIRQIEGRSLAPFIRGEQVVWPERTLFTHMGRWGFGQVGDAKYAGVGVRTKRWHMVSPPRTKEKAWKLFEVSLDPGEKVNVATQHPEVVARLDAAYDVWWDSIQPQLVNEEVVGPAVNPFKELYWEQFGY